MSKAVSATSTFSDKIRRNAVLGVAVAAFLCSTAAVQIASAKRDHAPAGVQFSTMQDRADLDSLITSALDGCE